MTSIDDTLSFKVTERGWPAIYQTHGLWYNRNTLIECSDGISVVVITYSCPSITSLEETTDKYQTIYNISHYTTEVYRAIPIVGYIEPDLSEECKVPVGFPNTITKDDYGLFHENVDNIADNMHQVIVNALQSPENWPPVRLYDIQEQQDLPF